MFPSSLADIWLICTLHDLTPALHSERHQEGERPAAVDLVPDRTLKSRVRKQISYGPTSTVGCGKLTGQVRIGCNAVPVRLRGTPGACQPSIALPNPMKWPQASYPHFPQGCQVEKLRHHPVMGTA